MRHSSYPWPLHNESPGTGAARSCLLDGRMRRLCHDRTAAPHGVNTTPTGWKFGIGSNLPENEEQFMLGVLQDLVMTPARSSKA